MFILEESKLLTLSDEVLMMILGSLSTTDLIRTSRTCERLNYLCLDMKLMTSLINPPDDYESMMLVFNKCINKKTKVLSISSSNYPNRGYTSSISPSMLFNLNPIYSTLDSHHIPSALTRLHLIRQVLDGEFVRNITMFPKTLKALDLSGTNVKYIKEESHWFRDMSQHFTELEELTLKDCFWVTTHSLMAISKCAELTSLNMEGCANVGNSIPYCSLACFQGFPKLKILNLNNTDIRNSDLQSFCKIVTLEEFYFGKYSMMDDPYLYSVWDSTIMHTIACEKLRIIDISGCFLGENEEHRRHQILITIFHLSLKLEKVFAYGIDPIPSHILEECKRTKPSLEIKQASFH